MKVKHEGMLQGLNILYFVAKALFHDNPLQQVMHICHMIVCLSWFSHITCFRLVFSKLHFLPFPTHLKSTKVVLQFLSGYMYC